MAKEIELANEPEKVEISNEELKQLLQENLTLLKEVHDMTHKIKRYITFQKVMSFVYLVLIIGPIIFSILYLPPIIKEIVGQYRGLLNPTNSGGFFNNK